MFTAEKGVWSHEHSMWVLVDDMGTPAPFQSIPDTVSDFQLQLKPHAIPQ